MRNLIIIAAMLLGLVATAQKMRKVSTIPGAEGLTVTTIQVAENCPGADPVVNWSQFEGSLSKKEMTKVISKRMALVGNTTYWYGINPVGINAGFNPKLTGKNVYDLIIGTPEIQARYKKYFRSSTINDPSLYEKVMRDLKNGNTITKKLGGDAIIYGLSEGDGIVTASKDNLLLFPAVTKKCFNEYRIIFPNITKKIFGRTFTFSIMDACGNPAWVLMPNEDSEEPGEEITHNTPPTGGMSYHPKTKPIKDGSCWENYCQQDISVEGYVEACEVTLKKLKYIQVVLVNKTTKKQTVSRLKIGEDGVFVGNIKGQKGESRITYTPYGKDILFKDLNISHNVVLDHPDDVISNVEPLRINSFTVKLNGKYKVSLLNAAGNSIYTGYASDGKVTYIGGSEIFNIVKIITHGKNGRVRDVMSLSNITLNNCNELEFIADPVSGCSSSSSSDDDCESSLSDWVNIRWFAGAEASLTSYDRPTRNDEIIYDDVSYRVVHNDPNNPSQWGVSLSNEAVDQGYRLSDGTYYLPAFTGDPNSGDPNSLYLVDANGNVVSTIVIPDENGEYNLNVATDETLTVLDTVETKYQEYSIPFGVELTIGKKLYFGVGTKSALHIVYGGDKNYSLEKRKFMHFAPLKGYGLIGVNVHEKIAIEAAFGTSLMVSNPQAYGEVALLFKVDDKSAIRANIGWKESNDSNSFRNLYFGIAYVMSITK